MKSQEIISKAHSFIGTKFKFKGRARNGLDCIGLIYLIIEELDKESKFLQYFFQYGNNFDNISIKLKEFDLKISQQPQPSDILVFNINNTTCHFGICVEDNFFIHAYSTTKSVVKVELNDYWKNKIHTVIRIADDLK